MNSKNEQEILRHIESAPLLPVYLLAGEEGYLVRLYADRILARALPGGREDMGLSALDGDRFSADQAADALTAVAFGGGRRAVLVTDLEPERLSPVEFSKLEQLLEDFPAEALLVLRQINVPASGNRWRALIRRIEKLGAVFTLPARAGGDAVRFLTAAARREGATLSDAAARHLLARTGGEMDGLSREIAKLSAAADGGEITPALIDALTAPQLDAVVFDLARRLTARDLPGALAVLESLLAMGEEPIAIWGALGANFIDLARADAARAAGRGQADMLAAFPGYKGREFRVKNAFRDVARLPAGRLDDALSVLVETDYRLKSSRTDRTVLLTEGVVRLHGILTATGRGAAQ